MPSHGLIASGLRPHANSSALVRLSSPAFSRSCTSSQAELCAGADAPAHALVDCAITGALDTKASAVLNAANSNTFFKGSPFGSLSWRWKV